MIRHSGSWLLEVNFVTNCVLLLKCYNRSSWCRCSKFYRAKFDSFWNVRFGDFIWIFLKRFYTQGPFYTCLVGVCGVTNVQSCCYRLSESRFTPIGEKHGYDFKAGLIKILLHKYQHTFLQFLEVSHVTIFIGVVDKKLSI